MRLGLFSNYIGRIYATVQVVIVVCSLNLTIHSTTLVPDEWDEVFETARAVLAKLPEPARIEAAIKDAQLREAVLRTYGDLKACARVHKDQSRSTKQGALSAFERAFKSVQIEAERSEYQACAAKCRGEAIGCEKGCESARKKLCPCKLTEFACFALRCVIGG